ncbi:hypothetical protein [Acidithiobacillus caldus]|nr:hypothetical protein [Acidithiobacillus caldus]
MGASYDAGQGCLSLRGATIWEAMLLLAERQEKAVNSAKVLRRGR